MSQTTYSYDSAVAVPGLLADGKYKAHTRIAYEDLEYGRFVRVRTDGKVEYATDDSGTMAGVTVYVGMTESTRPQGSKPILAGQPVTILYQGDVWVSHSGTAGAELATVLVHNDDTDGTTQAKYGKSTAEAASANVIRTLSSRAVFVDVAEHTSTLAKVRVNFP